MSVLDAIYRELGEEGLKKARWQETMRAVGFFLQVAFLLAYVGLWLLGGLAAQVARLTNDNPWLFALAFFAGEAIFNLPLRYLDRWVEIRLGTNRQGFGGWLLDWLKNALVNVALLSLLFGTVFALVQHWAKALIWGALVLALGFALLLFLLQPLLLRMQFKTVPLEDPELGERIEAVFAKAGVPFRGVYRVAASEKTKRGNAAVVPKAGGYEVVFFDTLLKALDPEALAFVVAHELGHVKHRDLPRFTALFALALYLALLVGYGATRALAPAFGVDPGSAAGLPLFYLGSMLTLMLSSLATNAFGRSREFAADRFAFELTGDLGAFERSFAVLARQNLADPDPPGWIEVLLHNHPSIKHRWEAGRRYFERRRRGE